MQVLDLGAGTGKLTEALVSLDREVLAVDPVEEMLDELELAVPGVPRILGTAEDIPIDDDSVDAVVAGQAWHWFEPHRAIPEIARVLRPGGVLGLVWNSRDLSADWLREAGEIMHDRHDASETFESYVRIGPPFGPVDEHTVAWTERMTRARFLDLVRSRSYFLMASPEEQAATIAALETLLDTHPDVSGAVELEVPYLTRCFRARLG
ncbi:class I SAM-dependent methyltransferase [Agromyces sp. CF514]|uniref:class I SAM-dependent methyltransferase n=1 Tax=Agromyces sp. CF514 TaxID=1881031 RepID=UPI000AFF38E9|nr:class I SAM-dependent methyltransferase [Agromyces sp. CF514]